MSQATLLPAPLPTETQHGVLALDTSRETMDGQAVSIEAAARYIDQFEGLTEAIRRKVDADTMLLARLRSAEKILAAPMPPGGPNNPFYKMEWARRNQLIMYQHGADGMSVYRYLLEWAGRELPELGKDYAGKVRTDAFVQAMLAEAALGRISSYCKWHEQRVSDIVADAARSPMQNLRSRERTVIVEDAEDGADTDHPSRNGAFCVSHD